MYNILSSAFTLFGFQEYILYVSTSLLAPPFDCVKKNVSLFIGLPDYCMLLNNKSTIVRLITVAMHVRWCKLRHYFIFWRVSGSAPWPRCGTMGCVCVKICTYCDGFDRWCISFPRSREPRYTPPRLLL